jgi:hypothetical protein
LVFEKGILTVDFLYGEINLKVELFYWKKEKVTSLKLTW